MKSALTLITISALSLLLSSSPVPALNPSLDISQYGHTAWKVRDGFSVAPSSRSPKRPMGISGWARNSACFASTAFALSRGNHPRSASPAGALSVCSPPAMAHFGLAHLQALCWNGGKLTRYPELDGQFVTSLLRIVKERCGPPRSETGPALRNPRRRRALFREQRRLRHRSFGVWVKIVQGRSGPAQTPEFGDGSPVLQNDMRCRECGSVISAGPTADGC